MTKPCAYHPETGSTALCLLCGAALCNACRLSEAGYVYCPACYRSRKLGALGGAAGGAEPEAAPRSVPERAEGRAPRPEGAFRCPLCGARWVQPYCPVCAHDFGAPDRPEPGEREAAAEAAPETAAASAPDAGQERSNFAAYFASSWGGAVLRPWDFFAQIPKAGGFAYPIAYLWALALPPLAWSYLFARTDWVDLLARGRLYAGLAFLLAPTLPFVLAASLHFYGRMMGGALTPSSSLRIVVYACSPLIFHGIPYLGAPLKLWAFALMVVGLERSAGVARTRAAIATASAALSVWIVRYLGVTALAWLATAPEDPTLFVR